VGPTASLDTAMAHAGNCTPVDQVTILCITQTTFREMVTQWQQLGLNPVLSDYYRSTVS